MRQLVSHGLKSRFVYTHCGSCHCHTNDSSLLLLQHQQHQAARRLITRGYPAWALQHLLQIITGLMCVIRILERRHLTMRSEADSWGALWRRESDRRLGVLGGCGGGKPCRRLGGSLSERRQRRSGDPQLLPEEGEMVSDCLSARTSGRVAQQEAAPLDRCQREHRQCVCLCFECKRSQTWWPGH